MGRSKNKRYRNPCPVTSFSFGPMKSFRMTRLIIIMSLCILEVRAMTVTQTPTSSSVKSKSRGKMVIELTEFPALPKGWKTHYEEFNDKTYKYYLHPNGVLQKERPTKDAELKKSSSS